MDVIHHPISGAPPPHNVAWADQSILAPPGQRGALVSRTMSMTRDGMAGALLGFWDAGAGSTAGRRAGEVTVGAGRRYRVVTQQDGCEPAAAPTYVQLTIFDGPRDPVWTAALLRAGAERIWPAVRVVPGITGGLVCLAPDGGALVVTLAVSVEALEAALKAVMSTELLPGEDPALLTGPDRVDVHRLLDAQLPEAEVALAEAAGVHS